MTDDKPDLDKFGPNKEDGITAISAFHDVPWTMLEGAYIKVRQDVTDHTLSLSERRERDDLTQVREGEIVGRGEGVGVYYSGDVGEVMTHSIGPALYIRTKEGTVLEFRTGKELNEVLDFKPGGKDE